MKIIDRNGRLFGKISVIDVLVVLVVLVMAAALYFKGHQTHTGVTVVEQPITFQIRVRGVNDYVAAAIREKDGVYDHDYSSGGRALGEITDIRVEREPGTRVTDGLGDGTSRLVEVEGTVDLLITVKSQGLIDDRSYAINRVYNLGVNSSRNYYTKRVNFTGMVAGILD